MQYRMIWFNSLIPAEYQECIDNNRTVVESAGHNFQFDYFGEREFTPKDAAIQKDIYALYLARSIPDLVVLDCDIMLNSAFVIPNDGLPYFSDSINFPCICAFAVNGQLEFFEEMQRDKERRGIKDCWGFPQKLLRNKSVGRLPDVYLHKRLQIGGAD